MKLIHATLLLLAIAAECSGKVINDLKKLKRNLDLLTNRTSALEAFTPEIASHLDWVDDHADFTQWVVDNQFDEEPFTNLLQSLETRLKNLEDRHSQTELALQCHCHCHIVPEQPQCPEATVTYNPTTTENPTGSTTENPTASTTDNPTATTTDNPTAITTENPTASTTENPTTSTNHTKVWLTVVAGGYTGSARTDAVQVIGGDSSLVLPSITLPVYNNRMTTLGTTIYSCGGYISSGLIDTCYTIAIGHNTWQTSHPLPRASDHHHISGANGVIMAIYEDGSLSITNGSESASYEGVFDQSSYNWLSCLAHNATHSYYLHRGIVYMNNDAINPTHWENIAEIDLGSDTYGTACFLFESELFVTRMDKLFIMNTDTFSVMQGASPNTPRRYHGMGLINDRVAVLGGWDGSSGSSSLLDSIETYDRQTNTWQTVDETLVQPMYRFGIVSVLY